MQQVRLELIESTNRMENEIDAVVIKLEKLNKMIGNFVNRIADIDFSLDR